MDRNGNLYTFLFAAGMVVVVGLTLALLAELLKPAQKANVRIEKMQNILTSVNVESTPENAENLFNEYIKEQVVIDANGKTVTGDVSAFDIDLKKELAKKRLGKADQELFPLFVAEIEGSDKYIIPMRGKGLWGPIWGFIALNDDCNTVYGANFDHKTETPGLGAEIRETAFGDMFKGLKINDASGVFISLKVKKGGASEGSTNEVDAITGGTITSDGVTEMLDRTLQSYLGYFKSKTAEINNANTDKPNQLVIR